MHIPIIYCEIYLQTYRHDMTYSVLKVPLNPNQPTPLWVSTMSIVDSCNRHTMQHTNLMVLQSKLACGWGLLKRPCNLAWLLHCLLQCSTVLRVTVLVRLFTAFNWIFLFDGITVLGAGVSQHKECGVLSLGSLLVDLERMRSNGLMGLCGSWGCK